MTPPLIGAALRPAFTLAVVLAASAPARAIPPEQQAALDAATSIAETSRALDNQVDQATSAGRLRSSTLLSVWRTLQAFCPPGDASCGRDGPPADVAAFHVRLSHISVAVVNATTDGILSSVPVVSDAGRQNGKEYVAALREQIGFIASMAAAGPASP